MIAMPLHADLSVFIFLWDRGWLQPHQRFKDYPPITCPTHTVITNQIISIPGGGITLVGIIATALQLCSAYLAVFPKQPLSLIFFYFF
jgi:hypothetical protein